MWCSPRPAGLCDAIFRACPLIAPGRAGARGPARHDLVPRGRAAPRCPTDLLSFLLFPVERPQFFDAVVTDATGDVQRDPGQAAGRAARNWIWGAFKMPGHVLHELHALWEERGRRDEYIGTLVNA